MENYLKIKQAIEAKLLPIYCFVRFPPVRAKGALPGSVQPHVELPDSEAPSEQRSRYSPETSGLQGRSHAS